MKRKTLGISMVLALAITACGGTGDPIAVEDDEALLQIVSEGGFVPVEVALNTGPRYTILGDGTLIFQGVTTLEYPGRLVPPYLQAQLTASQLDSIMAMVERIGLPDIDDEYDDSALDFVADASTEVITLWDGNGEHRYAVYALGIDEDPSEQNEAFLELIQTLDQFTAGADAETYEPETYRVVAGESFVDPEFEDLRPWPLEGTSPDDWETLPNDWQCTSVPAASAETFLDATQATTWENPNDPSADPVYLLVRPLFPGEDPCSTS